ncbi:hypothetical protein MMC19_004499 [Ptychographa xylographoides]|nr:hypothetical protein [Ptychographa xylographoides]
MARKATFTIRTPGRGSSAAKDALASAKESRAVTSPMHSAFDNISKAERLLGPSETGGNTLSSMGLNPMSKRERLRKKCSSISITISECRLGSARAHRKHDGQRTQSSSPVLGPADNASVTSFTGTSLRTKPSSSTIRSFYDPAKSPLAVSQQTSASSARDMALRKGYPPVLSPLRHATFRIPDETLEFTSRAPRKQAEMNQRRDTNKDIPTMVPRSEALGYPLSSRSKLMGDLSLLPGDASNYVPHPPLRQNWPNQISGPSRSRLKTERRSSRPFEAKVTAKHDEQVDVVPAEPKLMPKKSVENWLDDAEIEDAHDAAGERNILQRVTKDSRASPNSSHESSDRSSSSVRTLTSQVDGTAPRPRPARCRQPSPIQQGSREINASPFKTAGTKLVRANKIVNSDLHVESVLALSSDEDDGETELKPRTAKHEKALRNRIDVSAENQDTSALPIGTKPSQPEYDTRDFAFEKEPSDLRRKGSLRAPNATLPASKIPSRISSVQWSSDKSRGPHPLHPSARPFPPRKEPEAASSDAYRPITPSNISFLNDDSPRSRLSRIMAVSPEEEKLLSAMRSKRASMRKAVLEEGITLAIEQGLTVPRPKTADATSRSSSYFEPDMTLFPNPPATVYAQQRGRSKQRLSRATVSSEDLRSFGQDVSRADVEPHEHELKYENEQYLAPGLETLSLVDSNASMSDFISSPTVSHEAPRTPISGENVASLKSFGHEGQSGYIDLEPEEHDETTLGHVRKRTMSSVLCLDGVEDRAREAEEEEDLAMWAMGSGI